MSAVRDKLLDVASDLFFKNGYNSTGINQIVQESGVAIGSLYKHFPSKSDLLIAYLIRANDVNLAAMRNYTMKAQTPREQIFAVFDFHIEFQLQANFAGCNFIKINAEVAKDEKRVIDLVREHKSLLYDFISGIVTHLPNLSPQKTKITSDAIYLLLEGAIVDSTIQNSTRCLQAAKNVIETII